MTGEILAHELTPGGHHGGPELPGLPAAVGGAIEAVCADGAYDSFSNHGAILAREARPFVGEWIPRIQSCSSSLPPRKGATISPAPGMKDPPPPNSQRGEARPCGTWGTAADFDLQGFRWYCRGAGFGVAAPPPF